MNSSNFNLQPFALDLSSLRQPDVDVQSLPWQAGSPVEGRFLKYFPYGNDFIEVFTKDGLICLAKIGVSKKGVIRNVIASDIAKGISKYGVISEFISDICFHSERLFIAYKIPEKGTSVFSYDIVTKMMKEVLLMPACDETTAFKSRFLCAGEKIYYLSMELGIWDQDVEVKSHLTTITYGKL